MNVEFIFFDHPAAAPLHEHWRSSIARLLNKDDNGITVLSSTFQDLTCNFDCVVSPANSYGIMDGGIDLVYSRAFSARGAPDYLDLSRAVQDTLDERYFGFAPPTSCTLVTIPERLRSEKYAACRVLAVCPTMRFPSDVSMVNDLIYNSMWLLLVELEHWNAAHEEDGLQIRTVAVPGLATGTGLYDKESCAHQMVLAVRHFREARRGERRDTGWATQWKDVMPKAMQVTVRANSGRC